MTWRRLLRLRSPDEIVDRARQGIARFVEQRRAASDGTMRLPTLAEVVRHGTEGELRLTGPFFASAADASATTSALTAIDPHAIDALTNRADRLLGRFRDLLGYQGLDVGDPTDWWRDPVSGERAPARHWTRIHPDDPAVSWDPKVIWELGRHQDLVVVAQAWFVSPMPRFASHLNRQLASWLDANPPKSGPHWVSSLELALRSIAWAWILALAADALTEATRRRMFVDLAMAGHHIERFLSTWSSPNTHLTGEALGLFILGTAFPQFRSAERWRSIGCAVFERWIPRHVRRDGTYVEQSSWYHRYTTDFVLHYVALSRQAGRAPDPAIGVALDGLLTVLASLTRPDGTMPLIGDDDGGRLLFLEDSSAAHPRTALAIGAALTGRADLAGVAGAPPPELAWLLGAAGLDAYRALPARQPAPASHAFRDGGLFVVRSGFHSGASLCVIDAGPHGFLNGGHAHADSLSVDLTIGGKPLFVDPGTFCYGRSPEWRNRFRDAPAHNAVTIDGATVASMAGPFHWRRRADARALAWFDAGDVVLFAGTLDGFGNDAACAHRRIVAFIDPDLWIVRDEVTGSGEHDLAVHWQCAESVDAKAHGGIVTLTGPGRHPVTFQVIEPGGVRLAEGWVAPAYGRKVDARHIVVSRRARAPFSLTTILVAGDRGRGATAVPATRVEPAPAAHVAWGNRTGLLVTSLSPPPSGMATDAEVCWAESLDGRRSRIVAASLSHLALADATPVPPAGRQLDGISVTCDGWTAPDPQG